ncbi:PDCD11 family protein [Megaselia abdita]
MVIVEKSFPRGGTVVPSSTKDENQEFGAVQRKKSEKKPKVQEEPSNEFEDDFEDAQETRKVEVSKDIEVNSAELLSYQTIQEGMIIMGSVKSINSVCIYVSLPGRITGKVIASNVSDSYNKILSKFIQSSSGIENYKPLTQMFQVGQIVYAKVMEIKDNGFGKTEINLSLKPRDVHSELVHKKFRKGMILNCAIEEVQDHGFIMESSIKNLRSFLPKDKVTGDPEDYSVGMLISVKIEKLTQNNAASTAICREIKSDNAKIKDLTDCNLDYILPGVTVSFLVTAHLKDGLRGTIMNGEFAAYINEHHLTTPLTTVDSIKLNSTVNGKVLYIMPLTKLVYLTLNLDPIPVEPDYHRGDIVEKAVVSHVGSGGIVFVLNGQHKGLISMKTLKSNSDGNYDIDVIMNKYTKKSKHKLRILEYDAIDSLYICTDDEKAVAEKYFAITDLNVNDIVNAKVVERDQKASGYTVTVGKIRGLIQDIYLSPKTKKCHEGSTLRCRVISINAQRNMVYLSNRSEYTNTNMKTIISLDQVQTNKLYTGTIVKCGESFFTVKFFNDIKGLLYKHKIMGLMSNETSTFYEGQTMKFSVDAVDNDKILLGLSNDTFKMGEICPATVSHKLPNGLEIEIDMGEDDGTSFKGFIPIRLISDFEDLAVLKLKTLALNDHIKACCIVKNVFSLREVEYFSQEATKSFKSVKNGDIIRGFIKNVENDIVHLLLPIQGYDQLVKVHLKMFLTNSVPNTNIVVSPDQVVYVKVLNKEVSTRTLTISAKLTDVWDYKFESTSSIFAKYLEELFELKELLNSSPYKLGQLKVGDIVEGVLEEVTSEGNFSLKIEDQINGIIKKSFIRKQQDFEIGTKIKAIVLWIDYLENIVYLSHNSSEIDRINSEKAISENFVNKSGINAKILLKFENVILCSLKKGKNPIVYLPTRLHFNDFENVMSVDVKEGDFVKLSFIHDKYPIAVLDKTKKLWSDLSRKRKISLSQPEMPSKKQKITGPTLTLVSSNLTTKDIKGFNDEDDIDDSEESMDVEDSQIDNSDEEVEENEVSEEESDDDSKSINDDMLEEANTEMETEEGSKKLPGISDFWSTSSKSNDNEEDMDNDGDDSVNDSSTKLSKKQTAVEKFKKQKVEEARLREIEDRNADSSILPDSVDQFDRLVLSEPNNSKNWINYMVYHIQSSECDKARAVARRALKALSFRNDKDILNVWVALFNIELNYGTKQSFNDIVKEALQCNDPATVYTRIFEILSKANKYQELDDLVNIAIRKHKENVEIWKSAAEGYFALGQNNKAKQLLNKSLASLPVREHVNVTVIFANLNNKFGDKETAHALMEQIITSYPKRVDVWSQYIDMLLKDEQIDSARNTLERAVTQKIPIKKMKTILKKFLNFEEKYGDEEKVGKVKAIAEEILKNEVDC